MLQNRNFPVQRYVCISSRGPLPPLDLELYSRVSQVPHVWNKEGFDMRVLFRGQQEATAPSRKRDAAAPWDFD